MGSFHKHFITFALQYLYGTVPESPPYEEYDGSIPMSDWFCRRFDTTYEVWKDIKLAYRQGGMKRSMPVKGWARSLTEELHEMGAEIWVNTTRPYLRLDNIDPDTRFWLAKNEIRFDYLMYDEDKYSQLLDRVGIGRVCAVVEDLPEELSRASTLFGKDVCILAQAAHNRWARDGWPGAHEGISLRHLVMDRVRIWEQKHASHD